MLVAASPAYAAPTLPGAYYSPYNVNDPDKYLLGEEAKLSVLRYKDEWAPGNCSTAAAHNGTFDTTTMLSGWSIGRLGPIYYLAKASPEQLQQIDQILWIDPGQESEFAGGCDNQKYETHETLVFKTPGQILADWLLANPDAHMFVLSGDITAKGGHSGIQNYYFNDVRNAETESGHDITSRITVCNYTVPRPLAPAKDGHEQMFMGAKRYVDDMLTECPPVDGATFQQPWNP